MNAFPPPQPPPPDAQAPLAPGTAAVRSHQTVGDGGVVPSTPAGSPRRMWLVGVAGAVVALLIGGAVVLGGGDDDAADSTGTVLEWEEAWRTPLRDLDFAPDPTRMATVVWADDDLGAIVVGGEDDEGDEAAALVVLDPDTGEVRWSTDVVARFGPPSVFRSGDVLVVVSDIDDGSITSREARAFDIGTGDRVWRERDAGRYVVPVGDLIVMNRLHDPTDEVVADLLVLDAATGDTVFERAPEKGVLTVRAIRADGLVVSEAAADGPRLVGLSLEGDERWSRRVTFGIDAAPDVRLDQDGGTVVMVDDDEMLGLDVDTGDEQWSVDLENTDRTIVMPTPANDAVVVCLERDEAVEIRVHDLATGSERWNRTFDGEEVGFLGVSRGDAVLARSPVDEGCSANTTSFASSLELVGIATGETSWQAGSDNGEFGNLELRWATMQEQLGGGLPAFLTAVRENSSDDERRFATLLDPVTGEEILTSTSEEDWQNFGIDARDGAPVGFALVADDVIVFDPADHTRRITTDLGRVLGAGGDVLYVLDGDTVIGVR